MSLAELALKDRADHRESPSNQAVFALTRGLERTWPKDHSFFWCLFLRNTVSCGYSTLGQVGLLSCLCNWDTEGDRPSRNEPPWSTSAGRRSSCFMGRRPKADPWEKPAVKELSGIRDFKLALAQHKTHKCNYQPPNNSPVFCVWESMGILRLTRMGHPLVLCTGLSEAKVSLSNLGQVSRLRNSWVAQLGIYEY